MKKAIVNKINRWADNILRRYGFENWRTIWAFRLVDLVD